MSLGAPGRLARDAQHGGNRYTIFPQPTRPLNDLTVQHRAECIAATYSGYIQSAADLYRQCIREDGFFSGILATMAQGLMGLPVSFQGNPEMVSALLDADGTPGDYARMHPLHETCQVVEDGIGFGIGLGQYLLSCWRCSGIDMYPDADHGGHDRCKRCAAFQIQRPIGARKLYQLQWRDPRWLWRNTVSMQWYFTGRTGMVPICEGDGEWLLYRPYPDVDAWRHGPWLYATLAAIFARDTVYDRQRVSEMTTPTPVLQGTKPTTAQARDEAKRDLGDAMLQRNLVLSEEWTYNIVSAQYQYADVSDKIVEWASSMFEVGITGNNMGRKAQSAFTDAGIYKRTTTERRRFYTGTWTQQSRSQGLTWWGIDNYGSDNVPVTVIDVESPEDKLAAAKSYTEIGSGLSKLKDGADSMGLEIDREWAIETLQRAGIRARPKPATSAVAAKLELAPTDIAKVVRVSEARGSQGLPPLGDDRDALTITQLDERSKSAPEPPTLPVVPALDGAS